MRQSYVPVLFALSAFRVLADDNPAMFRNIMKSASDLPSWQNILYNISGTVYEGLVGNEQSAGQFVCNILDGSWQNAFDSLGLGAETVIEQEFLYLGNYIINIPQLVEQDFNDIVSGADDVVDIVSSFVNDPKDIVTEAVAVVTVIENGIESLFGEATAFLDCAVFDKCSSTGLVAGILGASCSSISNSPATTSAMPTSVLAQTSATPLLPTSSAVYMPSQTSAMPTATSCLAPTATPTIAANVAANCETYAELPADYCGITCEGICDYLNITFAEFYAWNPNVGSDCSGLSPYDKFCAAVSSTPASSSLPTTSAPPETSVAPSTPTYATSTITSLAVTPTSQIVYTTSSTPATSASTTSTNVASYSSGSSQTIGWSTGTAVIAFISACVAFPW